MKKIKKFDFKKRPYNPPHWLQYLAVKFMATPCMKKHKFKLCKVNMEGLKPPYLLLSNHASEFDFYMMYHSIYPNSVNNIVAIDAIRDHGEWFMRFVGCIGKRKFTKEMNLLKNMKYSANEYGNVICMYPEARYTFDGTTSYLPPSLGELIKWLKIPVVVMNMRGNYISCPQWNKVPRKNVPFEATLTQIVNIEEVSTLSIEEINNRIRDAFVYDDFAYQKEKNIIIDAPDRANNLNKILFQCPACGKEHMMYGEGTEIRCDNCKKVWEMTKLGELKAKSGDTEFSRIPDWFAWERENVRREVRNGTYRVETDVYVETLPNAQKFVKHGKGKLIHDVNGFRISCNAYGNPTELEFPPLSFDSVHIEFDYKKLGDAIDISTVDDSYWLAPIGKRDIIMKIAMAVEEIYLYENEKKLSERKKHQKEKAAAEVKA